MATPVVVLNVSWFATRHYLCRIATIFDMVDLPFDWFYKVVSLTAYPRFRRRMTAIGRLQIREGDNHLM
ncbi:MAG: hypothetical protein ACR2PA_24835 [Hyphomicrobiaceae bacterium]